MEDISSLKFSIFLIEKLSPLINKFSILELISSKFAELKKFSLSFTLIEDKEYTDPSLLLLFLYMVQFFLMS